MPRLTSANFEEAILRLAKQANLSPEEAMASVADLLPTTLASKYSTEEKKESEKKSTGDTLAELKKRAQACGINRCTSMKREELEEKLAECDEVNQCSVRQTFLNPSDWTTDSLRRFCHINGAQATAKTKFGLCTSAAIVITPTIVPALTRFQAQYRGRKVRLALLAEKELWTADF